MAPVPLGLQPLLCLEQYPQEIPLLDPLGPAGMPEGKVIDMPEGKMSGTPMDDDRDDQHLERTSAQSLLHSKWDAQDRRSSHGLTAKRSSPITLASPLQSMPTGRTIGTHMDNNRYAQGGRSTCPGRMIGTPKGALIAPLHSVVVGIHSDCHPQGGRSVRSVTRKAFGSASMINDRVSLWLHSRHRESLRLCSK